MSLFKLKEVAVIKQSNKAKHSKKAKPFNQLTAAMAKEEALKDMKASGCKKGLLKLFK